MCGFWSSRFGTCKPMQTHQNQKDTLMLTTFRFCFILYAGWFFFIQFSSFLDSLPFVHIVFSPSSYCGCVAFSPTKLISFLLHQAPQKKRRISPSLVYVWVAGCAGAYKHANNYVRMFMVMSYVHGEYFSSLSLSFSTLPFYFLLQWWRKKQCSPHLPRQKKTKKKNCRIN